MLPANSDIARYNAWLMRNWKRVGAVEVCRGTRSLGAQRGTLTSSLLPNTAGRKEMLRTTQESTPGNNGAKWRKETSKLKSDTSSCTKTSINKSSGSWGLLHGVTFLNYPGSNHKNYT